MQTTSKANIGAARIAGAYNANGQLGPQDLRFSSFIDYLSVAEEPF